MVIISDMQASRTMEDSKMAGGKSKQSVVEQDRFDGTQFSSIDSSTGPRVSVNEGGSEDMPLLMSDTGDMSDSEESNCLSLSATGQVSSGIKEKPPKDQQKTKREEVEDTGVEQAPGPVDLSPQQFQRERRQVMAIVVKYIATKITNSFPPETPARGHRGPLAEIPLDKFLLILTSRLSLSLPMFMKGIIYLFRYMDIIYLLRYLNQSNNYANHTGMGFSLRQLIVGCYKLALSRENLDKDWGAISGIPAGELNVIVKTIVSRLNGKLGIKNIELVKLRLEIFRFVKMVTKTA